MGLLSCRRQPNSREPPQTFCADISEIDFLNSTLCFDLLWGFDLKTETKSSVHSFFPDIQIEEDLYWGLEWVWA